VTSSPVHSSAAAGPSKVSGGPTGSRYWTKVEYRAGAERPRVISKVFTVTHAPVIAIVDDDPSVRRSLHRLLESAGYGVTTFASAGEFLDSLSHTRTACLVLDIHLDGMSGFELQERLAADGAGVPIVFITAHDDAPTREGIKKSTVGHLWKPFDDQALLHEIGKAIGMDKRPIVLPDPVD
jgi:FixJ family two-component response regulator